MNDDLKSSRNLSARLKSAGITQPRQLTDAIADADRIRAGVPNTSPEALAQAIGNAILKDKDPATDKAVQEALARTTMSSPAINTLLSERADEMVSEAVADSYDDIITNMQEAFKAAADDIADAYQIIGNTDLTAAHAILAKGPAAAAAWGRAQEATTRINHIRAAWDTLGTATGNIDSRGGKYQALIFTTATLEQFRNGDLGNAGLNPWKITTAGHPLALASHKDYRARINALTAELQAEQQERADKQFKASFPGQWG